MRISKLYRHPIAASQLKEIKDHANRKTDASWPGELDRTLMCSNRARAVAPRA